MKGMWTGLFVILLVSLAGSPFRIHEVSHVPLFSGSDAYSYLVEQCDFGPRPPGSNNLSLCRSMISEKFQSFGWDVTFQNFTYHEVECINIIARWNSENNSPIILGAHYDTRPPGTSSTGSGLGANDGASGVAVLLELSDILQNDTRSSVEIVLFDAEDSGGISGWDWIQGSTYYVSQLSTERRNSIHAMVLLDMVGDANLELPREGSSTTSLQNSIWSIAEQLGYNDTFIDSYRGSVTDDHRPFLEAGIPAVDLIQVPFPSYWHTLEDTPDKCSAESLEKVGEVIEVFVVEEANSITEFPLDQPMLLFIGTIVIVILAIPIIYIQLKRR
ncbi:MAG: M28 family peptidase [Candidatus Thorarchaeota archaeon]|nr:M28 family peptidase [Candidatus Thorarchaeota archaeon]